MRIFHVGANVLVLPRVRRNQRHTDSGWNGALTYHEHMRREVKPSY